MCALGEAVHLCIFHRQCSRCQFKDLFVKDTSCGRQSGSVRGFPLPACWGSSAAVQEKPLCVHEQLCFSGGVVSATAGQLHACQGAPEMQRESSNSINQFNIQQ